MKRSIVIIVFNLRADTVIGAHLHHDLAFLIPAVHELEGTGIFEAVQRGGAADRNAVLFDDVVFPASFGTAVGLFVIPFRHVFLGGFEQAGEDEPAERDQGEDRYT